MLLFHFVYFHTIGPYGRKTQAFIFALCSKKKKLSRKECPGCKQSFSVRHFDQHIQDNFKNNEWICIKPEPLCSNSFSNENCKENYDDNSSDDNLSSHRVSDIFNKYFEKNVPASCNSDSETEDEIWDSITMEDLDLDLHMENERNSHDVIVPNQNFRIGTLLIWFCIFLCSWQSYFMIPDSVMSSLLSFLATFFGLIGNESVIFASFATVFPGSIYMLWKRKR